MLSVIATVLSATKAPVTETSGHGLIVLELQLVDGVESAAAGRIKRAPQIQPELFSLILIEHPDAAAHEIHFGGQGGWIYIVETLVC